MAIGPNDAEKRVALLTGAFGNVGEYVIGHLIDLGLEVVCFDLPTPANRKRAGQALRKLSFETVWGDITKPADVERAVMAHSPDVVIHVAAIIPPTSIARPQLAHAVNVGGTANLAAACRKAGTVARFVLVSSYSVHGPSNPNRSPDRWTGGTAVDPRDEYAKQKVEAEGIVRNAGLDFAIIRLCAVFPVRGGSLDPDALRFSFALPYDRREQGIDVRDAALAIARAGVVDEVGGMTLDVGGGEGWSGIGGRLINGMMTAVGLKPFPEAAYRLPDPEIDASWYYENWVDTRESQALLDYQQHSLSEFIAERRRQAGVARFLFPILGGAIRTKLLKTSPYYGTAPSPDPRPFAEAVQELFPTVDAPR